MSAYQSRFLFSQRVARFSHEGEKRQLRLWEIGDGSRVLHVMKSKKTADRKSRGAYWLFMKLIERNQNSGSTRTIQILNRIDSPDNVNLIVDDVYVKGMGIKHFVVDAEGNEREVQMLTDCPAEKPYTAIARKN